MVESSEMLFHRSSVMALVSKHLMKMAIHDFNGRSLFAVVLTSSGFKCGRFHSVFASDQTVMQGMLENARPNPLDCTIWGRCGGKSFDAVRR